MQNPQTQAIYAYLEETDKIKVLQKYDDYFIPEIEASYDETRDVYKMQQNYQPKNKPVHQ